MVIEAGLAIIAACLPTLQYLIRKVTLDQIITSVRSTLSLHSNQSQQYESRPMACYANTRGRSDSISTNKTDDTVVGNSDSAGLKGSPTYLTKQTSLHDLIV